MKFILLNLSKISWPLTTISKIHFGILIKNIVYWSNFTIIFCITIIIESLNTNTSEHRSIGISKLMHPKINCHVRFSLETFRVKMPSSVRYMRRTHKAVRKFGWFAHDVQNALVSDRGVKFGARDIISCRRCLWWGGMEGDAPLLIAREGAHKRTDRDAVAGNAQPADECVGPGGGIDAHFMTRAVSGRGGDENGALGEKMKKKKGEKKNAGRPAINNSVVQAACSVVRRDKTWYMGWKEWKGGGYDGKISS